MAELSSEWSDSELESAVDAYLWMLNEESNGKPFNKAEVRIQSNLAVVAVDYQYGNMVIVDDEALHEATQNLDVSYIEPFPLGAPKVKDYGNRIGH